MITWTPVEHNIDPDTIRVEQDGREIGIADVSDVSGMPDSIGGVAPDAVRELVEAELNKTAYEADRRTQYVDGRPDDYLTR